MPRSNRYRKQFVPTTQTVALSSSKIKWAVDEIGHMVATPNVDPTFVQPGQLVPETTFRPGAVIMATDLYFRRLNIKSLFTTVAGKDDVAWAGFVHEVIVHLDAAPDTSGEASRDPFGLITTGEIEASLPGSYEVPASGTGEVSMEQWLEGTPSDIIAGQGADAIAHVVRHKTCAYSLGAVPLLAQCETKLTNTTIREGRGIYHCLGFAPPSAGAENVLVRKIIESSYQRRPRHRR